MANTSTLLGTLPIKLYGNTAVYMYSVAIDTINTDLTIRTAAAGKMQAIVGMIHDETSNHTMLIKSNTTIIGRFEKAGSYQFTIGGGIVACSVTGQAIVIQASAAIDSILIYIVEANQLLVS
jgi:hypothetical protein